MPSSPDLVATKTASTKTKRNSTRHYRSDRSPDVLSLNTRPQPVRMDRGSIEENSDSDRPNMALPFSEHKASYFASSTKARITNN